MLGRDALCFGTLRQGQAVPVGYGWVRYGMLSQGGLGEVR